MSNRPNELEGLVIKNARKAGACYAADGRPCAFLNRSTCPSLSYNGWNCMSHDTVAVPEAQK